MIQIVSWNKHAFSRLWKLVSNGCKEKKNAVFLRSVQDIKFTMWAERRKFECLT